MELKVKNNLTVLVAVLITLAVCLGVFIGYKAMTEKKDNPTTIINNRTSDVKDNSKVTTIEKSADERYKEYLSNLKKEIKNHITNEMDLYYTWVNHLGEVKGISVYINNNLDLIADDSIIDTNVLSMFIVNVGNGGYRRLYYIKDDGKMYSVAISPDIKIDTSDIKSVEYKNIIYVGSVANTITNQAVYVDIDGNMYSMGFE